MNRHVRRKYDQDVERVQDILRRWDPIGVLSDLHGSPAADEYDGYAPQVLSLLYRGVSPSELANYLEGLRTGEMGLSPLRSRDEDVAEELLALALSSNVLDAGSTAIRQPPPTPAHARVVADVRTYGWHVMGVFNDSDGPGWAYSIGLVKTFSQQEIIVFGLGGDTMYRIINNVAERMKSGVAFSDGTSDDEILSGYPCIFRSVAARWVEVTVGFAIWFYGTADFPLLQLFWPDKQGAFPWEDRCDPTIRALQPRLYASDPEVAGAEWLGS